MQALLPAVGSEVAYGLGYNSDPFGTRLRWAGWNDPFKVLGKDNVKYPNNEYPDEPINKNSKERKYHFSARANGFIYAELDERALPALADCWLLSGDENYARVAAVLLDALAINYSKNRRGPLDYPIVAQDVDRGGRLQRPYYQVARALMNYVHVFDALLTSDELEKASLASGMSRAENIIRNLLWDGAIYCLGYAYDGHQLHNGHADYVRGAAAVGLLLNVPILSELLFSNTLGFPAMLSTNIDRNGFYYESSHSYSQHCMTLYQSMADLYESALKQNWHNAESMYSNPIFVDFLHRYADKTEVGGRIPMTGDDGPARGFVNNQLLRVPDKAEPGLDRAFVKQLETMWILLLKGGNEKIRSAAAEFLRNAYADKQIEPPLTREVCFKLSEETFDLLEKAVVDPEYFINDSVLYGSKGFAIIRGGNAAARHGFQMIFGPQLNHGQLEALSWTFYNYGGEWSYDPGYFNTHYRMSWTSKSVAHQQMLVNGENVDTGAGGGEVMHWQANNPSGIQYVMAKQPSAYETHGGKRFERTIAQVDRADNGELEYWLDIGLVAGGEFRDDSFHTLFADVEYDREFEESGEYSMLGDAVKGMEFLPNWRLSGHPDKGFYWRVPGNGYALLLQPALWKGKEKLSARYYNPSIEAAKKINAEIKVDFLEEEGREYYSLRSMAAPLAPSLAYMLRRDRGDKSSIFAKVLRFQEKSGEDPIAEIETLPVEATDPAICRAWLIRLRDGRSDLWLFSENAQQVLTVRSPGLAEVSTDARLAVFRFSADNTLTHALSSEASVISFDGKKLVSGEKSYSGVLLQVDDSDPTKTNFLVEWETDLPKDLQANQAFVSSNTRGKAATWTLADANGNKLTLADKRFVFGRSKFTAVDASAEKRGYYYCEPYPSRFYSTRGKFSTALAIGKVLRLDGECVAYIRDVEFTQSGPQFLLYNFDERPFILKDAAELELLEAVPGDKIIINNTLRWHK